MYKPRIAAVAAMAIVTLGVGVGIAAAAGISPSSPGRTSGLGTVPLVSAPAGTLSAGTPTTPPVRSGSATTGPGSANFAWMQAMHDEMISSGNMPAMGGFDSGSGSTYMGAGGMMAGTGR